MTEKIEQVLADALTLPANERAQLAERLFTSLDISHEKLEQLKAGEVESRIDAYERGEIKTISAEDVFKNIYNQ